MIRLIGVVGKIFVLDLASDMEGTISITGGISKDVDENICTLEELKYIETSFKTKRVSMSGGDFSKVVERIAALEDKQSGGGTASYPSFTGNADKVLTVNATEDGVEWTTALTQTYVDTQDSLLQDQIDLKANAIAISQSLALKADLIGGLIPASQLPSYVDDVLSFPDLVSFPSLGEDGKIYVAEDVNKTYRWGGSSYVEIGGGGVALGETSSTAYRGDNGKSAYDHSISQGNPHNTTTSDISEGTNLFFTEPRVKQTVLTGLDINTATPVLDTDQLLTAVGKLQSQINNIGSEFSSFVDGDDALNVVSGKLNVVVSPVGDNILQKTTDGLYVSTPVIPSPETIASNLQSSTIEVVNGTTLSVKKSTDADNSLEIRGNGLYVPPVPETTLDTSLPFSETGRAPSSNTVYNVLNSDTLSIVNNKTNVKIENPASSPVQINTSANGISAVLKNIVKLESVRETVSHTTGIGTRYLSLTNFNVFVIDCSGGSGTVLVSGLNDLDGDQAKTITIIVKNTTSLTWGAEFAWVDNLPPTLQPSTTLVVTGIYASNASNATYTAGKILCTFSFFTV